MGPEINKVEGTPILKLPMVKRLSKLRIKKIDLEKHTKNAFLALN